MKKLFFSVLVLTTIFSSCSSAQEIGVENPNKGVCSNKELADQIYQVLLSSDWSEVPVDDNYDDDIYYGVTEAHAYVHKKKNKVSHYGVQTVKNQGGGYICVYTCLYFPEEQTVIPGLTIWKNKEIEESYYFSGDELFYCRDEKKTRDWL